MVVTIAVVAMLLVLGCLSLRWEEREYDDR